MAEGLRSHADTKEQLIVAARSLFAAHGFDGTTVRDISERAGVNISLVSYHFGGKKGLYESCLGGFREDRLEAMKSILQSPESFEDFRARLRLHIEEILSWYVNYPETMQMVHREIDRGTPIVEDLFKDTLMKSLSVIENFLKDARKKGFIRSDLDPRIASHLVGASVHQIGKGDHVGEKFLGVTIKDKRYRTKVVNHLLVMLLEGMRPERA